MKRLEEILKVEPDITSPNDAAPVHNLKEAVEFRDVGFAYGRNGDGQAALRDINLTVRRGRTVGIVGRTGAGKTSLAQLLPRLHDVSDGAIRLDGRDIRALSLSDLRLMIGYVPQDPFLFSTTLKRNLAFGRDEVSDAEVARAVSLARLDRDIANFPQGLETIVGERGVTLSGGQKQRATLARALLIDPPILVLDDCLSSVDAETEAEILKGLKNVLAGKTCLIVSHRISAVKDADEILVLDDGAVIERGNHQSLLERGGLYAELYQQQQLAEELEHI
jgi:ATP-binding cassette subfamily B protein